jgi:hypothetical protein
MFGLLYSTVKSYRYTLGLATIGVLFSQAHLVTVRVAWADDKYVQCNSLMVSSCLNPKLTRPSLTLSPWRMVARFSRYNIPKRLKLDQIAIKYTKWPEN